MATSNIWTCLVGREPEEEEEEEEEEGYSMPALITFSFITFNMHSKGHSLYHYNPTKMSICMPHILYLWIELHRSSEPIATD